MAKPSKLKTNAMRLLDKHHITYTAYTYPETVHSADEVAPLLGVPASCVFKTLVTLADSQRHLLIMVPGDRALHLRLAAQAVHAKSLQMASQREAERLTGLKVGGISPLALLDKPFEVYLDASGAHLDEIFINGGQRGVNLRMRVADLLNMTGARVITATSVPGATAPEETEA
ncbi:MAG TPA: aminoacyl-tRNA deacylase [Ktedonobacteraceae bacterium]|nr:aminoacyl-tRNA deacylase [Ktedonobacteraceae bacterium]